MNNFLSNRKFQVIAGALTLGLCFFAFQKNSTNVEDTTDTVTEATAPASVVQGTDGNTTIEAKNAVDTTNANTVTNLTTTENAIQEEVVLKDEADSIESQATQE